MGFRIDDENGLYAGAWSRWNNPPRPLLDGETVVECEWDETNNRPFGVTVPLDRSAKHAENKAWWDNHPGFPITLADDSTHYFAITKAELTVNRLELLTASLEQRAATVFDVNGIPVTVPAIELATVSAAAQTAMATIMATWYGKQAAIEAATTQAEIDAITIGE